MATTISHPATILCRALRHCAMAPRVTKVRKKKTLRTLHTRRRLSSHTHVFADGCSPTGATKKPA